jgi:hypothetical protein
MSVYLKNRKPILCNMLKVAEKLDLCQHTCHLAVKLLDRVFSTIEPHAIGAAQFDLISAGCLMLAGKFDELDYKVPLLIDLASLSRNKINYYHLKQVEEDLVSLLDFNLMVNTPLTLLRLQLAQGLVFESDRKQSGKRLTASTCHKVE